MKTLIVAAVLAAAVGAASANEGQGGGPGKDFFQQRKKMMLADLDAQLDMMKSFRDCVAAADDEPAAKQCMKERQKREAEMRAKQAGKRKAEIDEQIEKLRKEKERLDQAEPPKQPEGEQK